MRKVSDFNIGDLFKTETGIWQVTDVGSRVIVAMNTSAYEDKSWYNGPPYAVAEQVFDENDLQSIDSTLCIEVVPTITNAENIKLD